MSGVIQVSGSHEIPNCIKETSLTPFYLAQISTLAAKLKASEMVHKLDCALKV